MPQPQNTYQKYIPENGISGFRQKQGKKLSLLFYEQLVMSNCGNILIFSCVVVIFEIY